MKKILSILILLLIVPLKVNASACSSDIKAKIFKKANAINIDYEYVTNNSSDGGQFKFVVSNIPKDISIEDDVNNFQYKNTSNNELVTIENISQMEGIDYKFYFFYEGNNCDLYLIKSQTVKLPYYNKYWNQEICKGLDNFTYCQKFTPEKVEYESLKNKISKYKTNVKEETEEVVFEDNNWINNILNNNLIWYLIPVIGVILIVVIILITTKRKRRKIL